MLLIRTVGAVLLYAVIAGTTASARNYAVIDVVGDSVSDGINPDYYHLGERYGWVHMLYGQTGPSNPPMPETIYDLWPGIVTNNCAVSGSTAAEWVNTNSYPYMQRVLDHNPDLVVLMIGGNDLLAYITDGNVSDEEMADYGSNVVAIIEMLRSNAPSPEIVVLDYYDLFDGFSSSLPLPYAEYRAMSEAVTAGSRLLEGIAESNNCFFISVVDDFMHHCYGEAIGDPGHLVPDYVAMPLSSFDIHPETDGNMRLYELVLAKLTELHEIPTISGISSAGNELTIEWTSGYGQECVVERFDSLLNTNTPVWVGTNVAAFPFSSATDTNSVPVGFYRVRSSQ